MAEVLAVLDARLERGSSAPVAVAFSGGGDSLALLLAAKAWADRAGRRLIALTVDHRLQGASAEWAAWCAARAAALGVTHQIMAWEGDKPRSGLAAGARQARHRLIAGAARAAGARVILIGHTADDVLEAQAMRAEGLSTPSPRPWSPSPVWPEGRDQFLLRPLLTLRRAVIRAALADAGETWIEDPANVDPRQPRARVRALIAAAGGDAPMPEDSGDLAPLFAIARFGPSGDLTLPLGPLRAAPARERRRFLSAAIACVSGGGPPARGPFFHRLAELATGGASFSSTVGGAVTSSDGENMRMTREIGDRRSRPAPRLPLPAGAPIVWDGRFEVTARQDGLSIRPLAGMAARLSAAARQDLANFAPAVRRALPAIVDRDGEVACVSLRSGPTVGARGLVRGRLAYACGLVEGEAGIGAGGLDGLVL
jgi:tRNA(Ile)-lysidine synthase